MSRITKWKLEKTKVKVVFRLQFHATHIPQTGWEKLFISFIPTESGKSIAKTTKANVRNGTCKWADPIYETTRLLQDTKSKQYDEKLYKFVVAMGTSRSSILGEAIINLADYADAQKPSSVALPLQGCNSGTILHVTVQLLTSKTGFREFEQQRELREGGLPSGSNLNSHESGTGKISSPEEIANDHLDKANSRARFRPKSKELPSLEVGLNEEYASSAVGFDGSSSTSESLYTEKHDTSSLKSTVSGDFNGVSQDQSPHTEKENPSNHRNSAPGNSDLVQGWSSDCSIDNDLTVISNEENNRLRETLQVAQSSIFELKLELSSLQSNTEEFGVETQNLARQLAAEISSSEELGKEVLVLKEECLKFKEELERLKNLKLSSQSTVMEPIRTDLVHLKGLLLVEDGVRELLNKADLGFDERDISFLRSDFEALLDVLQGIKQGKESRIKEIRDVSVVKNEEFDVGFYQKSDFKGANDAIDGRNFELLKQLDESKVENENLARKMDEMECYYESLIHELEENQKQMIVELQSIRNEHSTCVYAISNHKAEIESIHQQMNEQIKRFSKEREDFDSLTKELERRANTSEAALKRARLNYSIAVDQLQKDLELLSFQVLSVYETNSNLIKQAFSEENPDFVQNPRRQSQINGGDFCIEDLKKSLRLQEDLYKKVEEELCEMHSTNLFLDVFSKALHETLVEANMDIRVMNEKIDEFAKQFEVCNASRDLLRVKLKKAMEEIQIRDEYKASYIARAADMLPQNQILEEKLENVSKEKCLLSKKIDECEATMKACLVEKLELENLLKLEKVDNENLQNDMSSLTEELEREKYLLSKKIVECEAMMKEYKGYGSKYEACSLEKSEVENLLKVKTLENENLRNEISSLREELKTFKAGFDDVAVSKENLQTIINFLHEKLRSLLVSYEEQCSGFSLPSEVKSRSLEFDDFKGIVVKLEEIQDKARKTILQLMEEKKELEDDRGTIEISLNNARSEILGMKQKFKSDIHNMVTKIDTSNARVEELQSKLNSVCRKFQSSSEFEEKHGQQNKEIFADVVVFEAELQKLTSKNRDLAQEILGLDTVYEELKRSELTVSELKKEIRDLSMSLNGKNEESATLESQLNSLKESLSYALDELNVERGLRGELEGKIEDITSQLRKVELEKSSVLSVLLEKGSSCIKGLESELFEMHEYLVATDVELACVRSHYETLAEILVQKLRLSDGNYREIQNKHLDAEEKLKFFFASEARYIEENAKSVKDLESLRFDLESSVAQNRVFSDSNSALKAQLEECKRRLVTFEEEQLKHKVENDEEDITTLILSKQELEIIVIVLKAKLDEQHARLITLIDYNDESLKLRKQFKELTHKLSEQVLKTEEFKNLSIHLKDLKDKAEADALLAREKREPEGPSVAMQESLRIAFLKEQYETKIQELRQQLSISKKHGEEMLWKLQDVVDEIENRKKSEALHLKRNKELSSKILELEGELQSVLTDKRERVNDYDRIKAELECALLSLECCKEEKEKLVGSLQELKEENSRMVAELDLRKGWMENSKSVDRNSLVDGEDLRDVNSIPNGEGGHPMELINARSIQGALEPKSLHGIPEESILNQEEDLSRENSKHLAVDNNHFRAESLRSSIERLHEELERMKNENSFLQTNVDPKLQDLEGEFTQLQKANEELGSMFPSFNEIGGSGNALERVLALEIELAESLREKKKKKSTIQFQSSFLKQHSDEEAVFRSFRDINELIKEMLELKGRYVDVETDLKEMHDRYSQLSLQFAEVEGERQKLMMTLKNIRTPKKLVRSSSANIDLPS